MMPPKVLFTASTYGHILNFHLPYLRWFRQQGWTVHVACGGDPAPIPDADQVFHLPLRKRMTAPDNFRASLLLRRKIQEENYDLLSVHTTLAAFFTRLALTGLRRSPTVINIVHGYLFDGATSWPKRTLLLTAERLTAPCTDLLLTMNEQDYALARRYRLGKRVEKIPGVGVAFSRLRWESPLSKEELRAEFCLPPRSFLLIYPAEFSRRKSQPVLIRAMAELPEETALVLPGNGALLEECRALVRELGLEHRVFFPGHITDMAPYYAMADAAVTSSRSEGLPFNVMEALALGLPVVASAVKGHEDLIRPGENGLLYPYGDSGACAAAIRTLLEDESLREAMGARGRAAAAQYDLSEVFPAVTAEYETAMPVVEPFS